MTFEIRWTSPVGTSIDGVIQPFAFESENAFTKNGDLGPNGP